MGCVPAPLHRVHVNSYLITGFLPVAVHSRFPINGIAGGKDSGGKDYPTPEVVAVPMLDWPNMFGPSFQQFSLLMLQASKAAQCVGLCD